MRKLWNFLPAWTRWAKRTTTTITATVTATATTTSTATWTDTMIDRRGTATLAAVVSLFDLIQLLLLLLLGTLKLPLSSFSSTASSN